MVYESMLLFGVVFIAILIFSVLFPKNASTQLQFILRAWLFLAIGAYFVWFWSEGRQTLAMKTWRIRLVDNRGRPVNIKRALVRYFLAWFWIVPGMAGAWLIGAKEWMLVIIPGLNITLWAMTVFFNPDRQFLHDRLAGTRLINDASAVKTTPAPAAST